MKTEFFSLYLIKLIVISSVAVSIGLTAILTGYLLIKQKIISEPQLIKTELSRIEISSDKKSILNADTKEVIFTIEDTKKYLKGSGYEYNPDTFQTTNAKYEGDCFLDVALKVSWYDRIVFSTGCLSGDLLQPWIGIYNFPYKSKTDLEQVPKIYFLTSGSGRNFIWSPDDKTITYEADLGLSGMTETRTIDSAIGEILERSLKDGGILEGDLSNWKTYRNEKSGFEIKYPPNWYFSLDLYKESFTSLKLEFCLPSFYDKECKYTFPPEDYVAARFPMTQSSVILYVNKLDAYAGNKILQSLYQNIEFTKTFNGIEVNVLKNDSEIFWKDASGYYVYRLILHKPENRGEFNKMFPTFKFTRKIDPPDWTTLENKNMGFALKYPTDVLKISTNKKESLVFESLKQHDMPYDICKKYATYDELNKNRKEKSLPYYIGITLKENNRDLPLVDWISENIKNNTNNLDAPLCGFGFVNQEKINEMLVSTTKVAFYEFNYNISRVPAVDQRILKGNIGSEARYIFIKKGKKVLIISYTDSYLHKNINDLIDDILSTFKFIEK